MVNVMKMDLYRMFRSRSTYYILIGLFAAIAFFIVNMHSGIDRTSDAELIVGLGFNDSTLTDSTNLKAIFMNMAASRTFLIGIVIFSVLFINREEVSGFTKNIAGQVQNRGMLALSKFVSLSVFTLLIFLGGLLTLFFVGNMAFESVSLGNLFDLLKEIGLQFLFHLAFAAIMLGIVTLIKQSAMSMFVGISICIGIFTYVYEAINNVINQIIGTSTFNLLDYTISGIIPTITTASPAASIMRGIIISMLFIVVMLAYSVTMKQKRDIH